MKAFFDLPFIQVALPIIIAIVLAIFVQNKRIDDLRDSINQRFDDINRRFDDMNKRFDEVIRRLDRIESKLENHGERIVKLEERTSLLRG